MTIDILLATYNGEKYIEEQITSIQHQSIINWRLLIRDDGSCDRTVDIIKEKQRADSRIVLLGDTKGNLGVVRNFEELLKKSDADYIMFSDQDDIWLPNKILAYIGLMRESEFENIDKPVLVFSDVRIVDESLKILSESFIKSENYDITVTSSPDKLAVANCIMGCTIMINSISKKYILPFNDFVIMHDWWIGIILSYYGRILYLDSATNLYRQHRNNQVGAQVISLQYYIKRIWKITDFIYVNYRYCRMIYSLPFKMNISRLLYSKIVRSLKLFYFSINKRR